MRTRVWSPRGAQGGPGTWVLRARPSHRARTRGGSHPAAPGCSRDRRGLPSPSQPRGGARGRGEHRQPRAPVREHPAEPQVAGEMRGGLRARGWGRGGSAWPRPDPQPGPESWRAAPWTVTRSGSAPEPGLQTGVDKPGLPPCLGAVQGWRLQGREGQWENAPSWLYPLSTPV